MTIYKDEYGFWRDGRERKVRVPKRCPECRSDLISKEFDAVGAYDDDIVDAYGVDARLDCDQWDRCIFGRDTIRCEECGHIHAYGPRYYWNPDSKQFDAPDILLPDVGERLFYRQERQKQIRAGQKVMRLR